MFLQVLYLPSTSFVKTEDPEEGFLGRFFNFALSVIGHYEAVFLQISCNKWDLIEAFDKSL